MSDPAVATERTQLAWVRTAAAMILVGALHLRLGAIAGGGLAFVPGLLVIAFGVLVVARPTRRRLGMGAGRPTGDMPAHLVTLAAASIAMASGVTVIVAAAGG